MSLVFILPPIATLFLSPSFLPSELLSLPLYLCSCLWIFLTFNLLCTLFYHQFNCSKPILYYEPPAKTLYSVSHLSTKVGLKSSAKFFTEDQHPIMPIIISQLCPQNLSLVRLIFLYCTLFQFLVISLSPSLSFHSHVHTHTNILNFYSVLFTLFLPEIFCFLFSICLHLIFPSYLAWLWSFSEFLYHLSMQFNWHFPYTYERNINDENH